MRFRTGGKNAASPRYEATHRSCAWEHHGNSRRGTCRDKGEPAGPRHPVADLRQQGQQGPYGHESKEGGTGANRLENR
jgi:hypothetical protein